MKKLFKLDLQFFGGEGASAGATGAGEGSGQAAGENATADAAQRLREMGVPEDKISKRASAVAARLPAKAVEKNPETEAATAAANVSTPTEAKDANITTAQMSWDEFMAIPENNRRMQTTIQSRLRSEKASSQAAREAMDAMVPAIELMARKYGLDSKNMDYKALADAISNDDAYYEEKAMELGTNVETAKRIDLLEREKARRDEADSISIQQQATRNHLLRLEQQGQAVKAMFPNFDLRTELQNPTFRRLVDPKVGLSVEDAYHAVHRKEIAAAQMQIAAQKTAEKISYAIQSGSKRPDESGTASQAPSVSTFDYRNASKAEREALKKEIRTAAAQGRKVYPK